MIEKKYCYVCCKECNFEIYMKDSHAVLRENSHAELWENSHAELRGNSHAVLRENSHAELRENSHAVLWENSHAVLRENSHAVLWGNSHAELRENSHAELRDFSAVHLLSIEAKTTKTKTAHIIKPIYPKSMADWTAMKGIPIKRGKIQLFKATKLDGTDFHTGKINYLKNAVAPDWDVKFKSECGAGLHLADSPEGAKYFLKDRGNYLLLLIEADIKDCKCFPGQPQYPMKIRARTCRFVKVLERVENGVCKTEEAAKQFLTRAISKAEEGHP